MFDLTASPKGRKSETARELLSVGTMKANTLNIKDRSRVFLSGYNNFTIKRAGIMTCPYSKLGARLEVDNDLSPLFPFINAQMISARYYEAPERIQFMFEGIQCTLYSHEIIAAAFNDHEHAMAFGQNLLDFLNRLYDNRSSLKPDYRKTRCLSPMDIYRLLPKTNCGECGHPSCLAFAGALSKGTAGMNQCPGAIKPIENKAVYPVTDSEGQVTGTIELDLQPGDLPPKKGTGKLETLLSEREIEVLKFVAMGATNNEIAEHLFVSPHTVKTHVMNIYEKLGVNDRTQAAVLAVRHHLV